MKNKLFKTMASLVITGFFLFLAFGSGDGPNSGDCPQVGKKCQVCDKRIDCDGYDVKDGLVVGPWGNYHLCQSCAEKKAHIN